MALLSAVPLMYNIEADKFVVIELKQLSTVLVVGDDVGVPLGTV